MGERRDLVWDLAPKECSGEVEVSEIYEMLDGRRNARVIEVVVSKVEPLKVNQAEKATIGAERTVEKTAA